MGFLRGSFRKGIPMRALQIFSFKKSVFERPNQEWICGRACLGDPCLAGPTLGGDARPPANAGR